MSKWVEEGDQGEGKKGGGFSLSLSLSPTPPPSHRNRNHTMNKKIFELWAGDELVTCTEDQEICAISGRKGMVWQIINHVISHSLFLCTYYLIEVPAKYSCQLEQLYLGLKVNKVILIEWLMRGGSVFVKKPVNLACYTQRVLLTCHIVLPKIL